MEILKKSSLARLYKNEKHAIDESYAELRLIRAACIGDCDTAASLFRETKLFGNSQCVIDTPYKRYLGLEGVRAFMYEWLPRFNAISAEVIPVIQTRANGHSVTEVQVDFVTSEGIWQVPFFVVADLRTKDVLEEVRLYTHCTFVPGLQAYRHPIFDPAHLEPGDPDLMTGAVREYYAALHHAPKLDVDRIMNSMGDGCVFGGYEPVVNETEVAETREEIRAKYEYMSGYIPRCVAMRYETLIDDGVNCIIEWVHIVSHAGQTERNRIAGSGIAAYERGEDGLLCSIRISDYANMEGTIDWSKLDITKEEAQKVHYVDEYSGKVGKKIL